MKKLWMIVILGLLVLSACSPAVTEGPADVTEPEPIGDTDNDVDPVEEPEKTVLEVISWWDISTSESLQELKAGFEANNPDIELEFTMVGEGYADKMLTMIAGGGELPDVMMLAMDKVPFFADRGAITNLDQYISDEYKNDIYPFVLNALSYEESVYAVARDVTPKIMYLNVDMFEDAGVDLPDADWTWDEFRTIAQALTAVDDGGIDSQWGFYFPKFVDGWAHWLYQNEGALVTPDGTASALDAPESIEAIKFLQSLILEDRVVPTESQAQQFGTSAWAPFLAGKAAMLAGGLSTTTAIVDAGINYTVLPLPTGANSSNTAFVNAWAIPSGAENPDMSWRILEYFSTEGQQIVLDTGMGLPASKSVDTSAFEQATDFNNYFIDSMNTAIPFPAPLYGNDYWVLIMNEFDLMWLGEVSVEDAVASIVEEGNKILMGDN